jgi:predicted PurR-regulated permease PerM
MIDPVEPSSSPSWNATTKLIVGLTLVAISAALVIQFRQIIGPLILAFILAYLVHPLAIRMVERAKVSWRMAVNLIYLVLLLLLIGSVTATGFATVQQVQSLIAVVNQFSERLPDLVANLSTQAISFGPFQFNFSQLNLQTLTDQALSAVQPMLGRVTTLISGFATSAAGTFGWALFVLIISYFLLAESGVSPTNMFPIEVPGYQEDIDRLLAELRNIWNAFLRGQMIIVSLVILASSTLMMILGVRYSVGIGLMAGAARFVPYLGPFVSWTVTGLVAFFQGGNHFGLQPLTFTIIVLVASILLDQIFDNIVVPRLLGQSLGVHPAAVLVSAIIATNLLGLIGLVLAAPVLATVKLLVRYIFRKMFDQDPWPLDDEPVHPFHMPWRSSWERLQVWWRARQEPKPGPKA